MTFKQEYLHRNGPFAFNFAEERVSIKDKIIQLIKNFHPNQWAIRGLQPFSYLQSFKQVYGVTSQQLTQIMMQFLQFLKDPQLSCQGAIAVMKTLVGLKEYKIGTTQSLKFDNKYFIQKLKHFCMNGIPYPLKNSDSYVENLIKVIKVYSKYGQQYFDELIQLAIQERDIKFLAIFIKSIKNENTAQKLLDYIFQQSSIFQRDTCFFYIIAQITLDFPLLNLNKYHQTLSQQIIKTITTIVDPLNEQQFKKLTAQDPSIGVQCTIKSIARILINCLLPVTENGWQKNWARIQRIFSIIGGIIDHTHQVQFMNEFLIFIKEFVKIFQVKYRKQRGMYQQINEDFVQQFQGTPLKLQIITEKYIEMFNELMIPLVPQLLYFQDGQVKSAKILSDLAMFQPQKYMSYILEEIKIYLQKDLTICSTYTSKMTILFLQQFIVSNFLESRQFTLLIECSQLLLDACQKLGISENLDILELVMRNYMYFPQNIIQELPILSNMTEDIINMIQQNMDPMSINLEATQSEQAELYTDFKNIYLNFIIRLNQKQIKALSDKILYKISANVPSHRQAYQFITTALSFKNPTLGKLVLDIVFKNLVVSLPQTNNGKKSQSQQISEQVFPMHQQYTFLTRNQQHIRFYSAILQCAFQYHPENLVSQWKRIQIIIVLMLRQVQNLSIFDWGMDVLFNVIINLEHIHLHPSQFFKNSNRKYQTMNNVQWIHPSTEAIGLLEHIKKIFYDSITKYMLNRYQKILQQSEKAQKLKSQRIIQIIFDRSQTSVGPKPIQVKQFINQFLDCLLVPSTPSLQDIEQKKHINKLLSIQYAVFSALQMSAQFTANEDMFEISTVFIKELGSLRKHAIEHLKWILQLLGHYNCLYDPAILKLFHYFWRQAHDQLYYSAGIQATNDKLHPFFYPVSYKKKQLFQNSFLIMTESYVTFMMRIQLFSMLQPMAYLNNPQFLQYTVPLAFSSTLDCSLKSYVPLNVNPHINYHFQILNICRLKLCLYNANSYIRKSIVYSKAGNEGVNKIENQKYIGAIRVIISNYKRNLNIFIYPCCMRDQTCWYSIQQILQISQYLQKKNDKVGIIQIIYLLIVFSFDFNGLHLYRSSVFSVEKKISIFDQDDQIMLVKILSYIRFIIEKINAEIIKKFYEKDATVLVLVLICFSQLVPIHHQIFQQIIPLIINITLKNTQDMMNMGKTFLFRVLNRFIKLKTQIIQVQNIPVKRSYSDFIIYRHLGGRTAQNSDQPAQNLITNKNENYYYPLSHMRYLNREPLNPKIPNEQILLKKICDEEIVRLIFKSILSDTELKAQESQIDVSYLSEQQPKRIYSNGHKIINFILDGNPRKVNIFLSFIDNFSNYPICFYHRLFRKMMINGGSDTVKIMQKIAKQYIKSTQIQQVKLSQFLLVQILPFCPRDEDFYNFYINFLVTCSKQQFQFANGCLLVTFCIDWRVSKTIFNNIIGKMREQKGPSRLRHLQVFNNYLLCTGRFSQEQAKNGILYLMKGIQQGTDQVSQLIVSMLIYCFIIPINLKLLQKWVKQSELQRAQKSKIYQLDFNTGYQISPQVRLIIQQIVNKTKQQTDLQSKNLKVYSKIAYKILSSILVHRFNDQFYNLFKDTMLYIINKPLQEGGIDEQIVSQLKDSQYPQHIYLDLIKQLKSMEGNTINVQKKKLRYIESVVINKIFCNDKIVIPDIFTSINEKSVTIDHIIAVSNMARIMKGEELTAQVERILNSQQKSTKNLNFLMAYLLAAGTRDFEWRQKVLNQILSFKKNKIVKQFVSYWWKGRTPETERQQRLCMLVRSVENPYSYFA